MSRLFVATRHRDERETFWPLEKLLAAKAEAVADQNVSISGH
jgi:hypothetical protein